MKKPTPGNSELNWTAYSLGLIGLFVFFQVMQWPLLPKFLDIYYHLSVMKGFDDAGGFVTKAFWEYAPGGRPHLYPPLLHVCMLALTKLGLSAIAVGRLVDCVLQPLMLLVVWRVCCSVYHARLAFFAVLVWSSVYSLFLVTITTPAFSLALIMILMAFLAVEKKRMLAAVLLTAAALYSHLGMGIMGLLTLGLYGLVNRSCFKRILISVSAGILLALPFLFHVARHSDYFTFVSVKENWFQEWDVLVFLLAAPGLFIALRRRGSYLFPLCLFAGMIPLAWQHQTRFISGHGLAGPILLAVFFLDAVYRRISEENQGMQKPISFVLGVAALFLFVSPVLHVHLENKTFQLRFFDRSVVHYLVPESQRLQRAKEFTIFFPTEYEMIRGMVQKYSEPGDILWSDFAYGGGLIALLSDRVTASAMLPEIKPYQKEDALKAAKLAVWYKSAERAVPPQMPSLVAKYGLEKVGETNMVHVYQNRGDTPSAEVPQAIIPTWVLLCLLSGFLIIVAWDFRRGS